MGGPYSKPVIVKLLLPVTHCVITYGRRRPVAQGRVSRSLFHQMLTDLQNSMPPPYKVLDENSSLSYGTSPAIWDHTVLPVTRHKGTRPALTPASKQVLDLPTPERWKAELT